MVVFVTRAGSGIGRAVAGLLVGAGHRVYGGVSTPEDRARLQREGTVRPLLLDVTRATSRQAALDRVLMVEGRLDALVLVAARPSGVVDEPAIFARNVWGPLALAASVASVMRDQGSGTIVFTGGGARRGSGALAVADLVLTTVIEVTRDRVRDSGVRVAQVDVDLGWRPVSRRETGEDAVAGTVARVVIGSAPQALEDRDDPTDVAERVDATVPAAPPRSAVPRRVGGPRAAPAPVVGGVRPGTLQTDPWVRLTRDDLARDDVADVITDDWSDVAIPMEDEDAFDESTDVRVTPAWLDVEGAQTCALVRSITRVGRGRNVDLQVTTDAQLSRNHFAIVRRGRHYFVEDAATANGTRVDGVEVASRRLVGGEWITAGETRFRFRLGTA